MQHASRVFKTSATMHLTVSTIWWTVSIPGIHSTDPLRFTVTYLACRAENSFCLYEPLSIGIWYFYIMEGKRCRVLSGLKTLVLATDHKHHKLATS